MMTALASETVAQARDTHPSWISIAAGVAISGVFLVVAVRGVSPSGVADAMGNSRPLPILIGLACGLSAYCVMGLRWRAVMQPTTVLRTADAVDQVTIANLVSLVLPARFGDVARVLLVQTRWGVPASHALGAILLERLSDLVMLIVLTIAIAAVIELPAAMRVGLQTVVGAAILAFLLLWCIASRAIRFEPLLARLPGRLGHGMRSFLPRMIESLQLIRRPRAFLAVITLSTLMWTLSGLMFISFASALRLPVPWYAGFVVLMMVNLASVVPSSPGGIGVFHYFSILAVSFWTADKNAALAFAVMSHALWLLVIAAAGGYGLARQGLSLRTLSRRS
jgi:uncharacterized protein (TIRG00374 family)